jgi:extracellular matrix protein 14
MTSIGKSYEGRDIHALRVSAGSNDSESRGHRKTILITGGLHGREWISTSSATYLLWSVITSFNNEPIVTKLLHDFDIVFIPVLNPDGYEYTWQTDRLWRKSRQQTKMRFCRGLDLDHTFGYGWDAAARQTDPCSESYGGEEPFQAVEASALAEWAKNETENGAKFVAFLDLHS